MLCQIYRILICGAKDSGHDLVWGCPLLGLSDPNAQPDVHWSPAKASAVVAWHREAAALESAKEQLMTPIGKATPKVKNELSSVDDSLQKQIRAVVKQTLQVETARTGRQGREGQRRRGKLRPGRDLHESWPSSPSRSLTLLPETPKRVAYVFCVAVLHFQGNGVHEISQRGHRHSSFPSQLQAASDPDASHSTPSRALQPPRSTSRDCHPDVVLSRTAQQWRSGPA